ncbi:MAG: choice-of-anchor D domain-containing protein [Bacteroidota bacterium]
MKFSTKIAAALLFLLISGNSALVAQTLTITAPNSSTVWCSGSTQNITWTSSGVATIRIEGSPDGTNYVPLVFTPVDASAGTYSYTIPGNFPTGNQYRVRLTDVANSNVVSTSDAFSLSAVTGINTQPTSKVVCIGQSSTLTVGAVGGNLTYQWKKDGTNISGATSATYDLQGVPATAGSYTVTVTGSCGTAVTSSPAIVTISQSPTISTHPVSQTVAVGGNVTFTVSANDANTYQWRKNGVAINNTSATLSLMNVQTSDAGDYDVHITNSCGVVTSVAAKLTVTSGIGAVLIVDDKLEFGTIQPDGSVEKTLLVRNTGDIALNVSAVTIGGADAQNFLIMSGNAPFTVAPNASHEIKIKFYGNTARDYKGTVSFTSNANFPTIVDLTGKIAAAGTAILTVPSALNFGAIKPNESSDKTLVISNTGSGALNVSGITLTGGNASNFAITGGNAPFTVAAGATHTVTLRFTGATVGNYTAIATIASNAGAATPVTLTGEIVLNASKLSITNVLNFGQTLLNKKATKTVKVTNSGTSAIMVNSATIEGTNASLFKLAVPFTPVTLNAGQSMDIAIEFLPTAEISATATLRIKAADGDLTTQLSGLGVAVLSIEDMAVSINSLQAQPNPAMESTIITAAFTKAMMIEVQVMDMSGRIIRTLQPMQMMDKGNYSIVWDVRTENGSKVSNGMYRIVFRSTTGILSLPVVIAE